MLAGKINYKTLNMYNDAHNFVLHIYALTKEFPQHESMNLVSQLRRAATSLPLNIAEGSGCLSFRAFLNFACFAYRSALEVEAALKLCRDLGYIDEAQHSAVHAKFDSLVRQLYGYMKYLERKADERKGARQLFTATDKSPVPIGC